MVRDQRLESCRSTGAAANRVAVLKSAVATVVGIVGAPSLIHSAAAAEGFIVYNGWGGKFDEHLATVFFRPFQDATGIEVRPYSPQNFALLRKQVRTGVYQFDFADYNEVKTTQATLSNLLEPVDFSVLDKTELSPNAVEAATRLNGILFESLSLDLVYSGRACQWQLALRVGRGPRLAQHARRAQPSDRRFQQSLRSLPTALAPCTASPRRRTLPPITAWDPSVSNVLTWTATLKSGAPESCSLRGRGSAGSCGSKRVNIQGHHRALVG